jgi:hypothetical protein
LVFNFLVGIFVVLKLGQSVLFSILDGVLDLTHELGVGLGNADVLNLALVAVVGSVVHGADIVLLLSEADVVANGFDMLVGEWLDLMVG